MFFKLDSFALAGIDAIKVSVEVHISNGLPSFTIVGLPDKAVSESRQRVRAAIINSGFKFPMKRIIINLSPADIRKEGAFYDLPIALSILAVSGQISSKLFSECCFVGELSLDGKINPVKGIISMVERAVTTGKNFFIVPQKIAHQASLIKNINIVPGDNLNGVVKIFCNCGDLEKYVYKDTENKILSKDNYYDLDLKDVKGQMKAKRALEIAVSGMHNFMMIGPPGAGKTMLAQRAITIMPQLSISECIEVTKIYSLYKKYSGELIQKRPFRSPHHTISRVGLTGGGKSPKPGEISLSHRGVLFLDEFSHFPKNLVEDLRQPLENKKVVIARNNISYCFPCSFMLIVATNPCHCGYFGDEKKKCVCSLREVRKFWKNLSGPIVDRIDMRVKISRLKKCDFIKIGQGESSSEIKKRVKRCIEIQQRRFEGKKFKYNSEASPDVINSWIRDNKEIRNILSKISDNYNLTARGMASILKVARTIADLDEREAIRTQHVLEALQYRAGYDFGNLNCDQN